MLPRSVTQWPAVSALLLATLFLGTSSLALADAPEALGTGSSVPHFDHVFLIILENNGLDSIIGNRYAPVLNALAHDYGLASNYHGVTDPSEPNYVAMLGGSSFGISNDNPYWYPNNTVHRANLMSQLEGAGLSWRAYFQGMPYPGYRGYCYPDKCNGIPDADTQYVSKHNGIVNFANLQTPGELAKMVPFPRLSSDIANGTVANLSYIVPDECHDMHGAPPWCVDSGRPASVQQEWLVSQGDAFVRGVVEQILSATLWKHGQDAIVVTFDEGNQANSKVATIVITNHGPRGVVDGAKYDHYSLLLSLEQTFGLGCLLNSCSATPMTSLFAITGSTGTPALPAPYAFPTGTDQISPTGFGIAGANVSLVGLRNWSVVPSVSLSPSDNVLASVSAASGTDAWAVGTYYPGGGMGVLATLGEHFDGRRWTAYPLPNVGVEENTLLGVSMTPTGSAWAVGYYVSGTFEQRTLVEHYNGRTWSVVPTPDPSSQHNILYGVTAVSDRNVWAVGGEVDAHGVWRTLVEHWNGTVWNLVPSRDPGPSGDQFYAVVATGANQVFAVGQASGTGFPTSALVERWNGSAWSVIASPADPNASALPLAVADSGGSLTVVGQQETDARGYAPYVAAGLPSSLTRTSAPRETPFENDLFGVTMLNATSGWAVGWAIDDPTNATYEPLIVRDHGGIWSVVTSPGFGPGSTSGLAALAAIPGGGLWAVGTTSSATGNPRVLIEYHA